MGICKTTEKPIKRFYADPEAGSDENVLAGLQEMEGPMILGSKDEPMVIGSIFKLGDYTFLVKREASIQEWLNAHPLNASFVGEHPTWFYEVITD